MAKFVAKGSVLKRPSGPDISETVPGSSPADAGLIGDSTVILRVPEKEGDVGGCPVRC